MKTFINNGFTGLVAKKLSKILISSCLLGQPVRYDGQSKEIQNPALDRWLLEGRLVPVCPEVSGGLPVPRPAAEMEGFADEILIGHGFVKTADNEDVSRYFLYGAQHVLTLCRRENIRLAILKENSPSCGSAQVYDGSFSHTLISGAGITTTLLRQNGITIFNEFEIDKAAVYLAALSAC
ncbi:MAG: DUF523 domain-containing protein [Gammaproteobacteria bacterium]|nr:DUF523 domain-containing protein [Gammaproteobacteria bacterium]